MQGHDDAAQQSTFLDVNKRQTLLIGSITRTINHVDQTIHDDVEI